jgi:UTP--glucose-1-phosphate uridylyltransferase
VPRRRFAPVKTTNDLLGLRSDAYVMTDRFEVVLAEGRDAAPLVDLDPDHFKLVDGFEERFAQGPPSLRECERLTVEGDVAFGADVVVRGSVVVRQEGDEQRRVEDGAVLEG